MKKAKILGKKLSKTAQKAINGGTCPSNCQFTGCFSNFIGLPVNGSPCALLTPAGQNCPGTVSNGQCCLH